MAQIQNAGLGEFRLRDLNDEINKLIREKRHWEKRIIKLGGPNYIMRSVMGFMVFFYIITVVIKCLTLKEKN